MYRGNGNGNGYNSASYANGGEAPFRSPRPRFQSSPRYQQQFAPFRSPSHHGQGNWSPNSPHGQYGPSPHGRYENPGNRSFNSPRSPFKGDRRGSYSNRGRGGYSPNYGTPRSDNDSNPGGSDNINLYYHPSMVQDPWAGLEPSRGPKCSETS